MTMMLKVDDKYIVKFEQWIASLPKGISDKKMHKVVILGIFNQNLWK